MAKGKKKGKKADKSHSQNLLSFFKYLQCSTKNSNVYERSHAFLLGLII